jgi:hypothetical protein
MADEDQQLQGAWLRGGFAGEVRQSLQRFFPVSGPAFAVSHGHDIYNISFIWIDDGKWEAVKD